MKERNIKPVIEVPQSTHGSLIVCMKDVSKGLRFLQNQHIPTVHRDLKPDAILRHKDGTWKIGDLGLSRLVGVKMTPKRGNSAYRAPELNTGKYDHTVDIYSFGLIMFEICYKIDDSYQDDRFKAIKNDPSLLGTTDWDRFAAYPHSIDNLIKGMLSRDAPRRPKPKVILEKLDEYFHP